LPAPTLLTVDEAARYVGARTDGLTVTLRQRIASVVRTPAAATPH
jgi:hypothetical protein